MAYTIDKKEYPFLCKDELERSLPVLKKAYLTYGEVAGKTMDYIFFDLFKNYKELKQKPLGRHSLLMMEKVILPVRIFHRNCSYHLSSLSSKLPNHFIAGGNFFGVMPYEGRYDAAALSTFSFGKPNGKYEWMEDKVIDIRGEVRDLKWLHTARFGDILVAGRNNDSLQFYNLKLFNDAGNRPARKQ